MWQKKKTRNPWILTFGWATSVSINIKILTVASYKFWDNWYLKVLNANPIHSLTNNIRVTSRIETITLNDLEHDRLNLPQIFPTTIPVPKFVSVYGQQFLSYRPFWDKCIKWPPKWLLMPQDQQYPTYILLVPWVPVFNPHNVQCAYSSYTVLVILWLFVLQPDVLCMHSKILGRTVPHIM